MTTTAVPTPRTIAPRLGAPARPVGAAGPGPRPWRVRRLAHGHGLGGRPPARPRRRCWRSDDVASLVWIEVYTWCEQEAVPLPTQLPETLWVYLTWLDAHDLLAPGSDPLALLQATLAAHTGLTRAGRPGCGPTTAHARRGAADLDRFGRVGTWEPIPTQRGGAPMATVQTVTGPVDGADLGRTLVHEHIRISYEGERLDPQLLVGPGRDGRARGRQDGRAARRRVPHVRRPVSRSSSGVIRSSTPRSRRARACRSCARPASTPSTSGRGCPFYWRARDPEEIAELYVKELTEGIANTGGIRAGAIKAATGTEVTPAESRCLTGAAIAQHEVGCAIITHTENSRHGDVQQDHFADGGADLGRVLIGHQDEQTDVAPDPQARRAGHVRRRRPHRARDPRPRRAPGRPRGRTGARGLHVAGVPLAGPHLRAHRAATRASTCRPSTAKAAAPARADRVAGVAAALHVHRHRLRAEAASSGA